MSKGCAIKHPSSTWLLCFRTNPLLSAQVPLGVIPIPWSSLWLCKATSMPSCCQMRHIQHYSILFLPFSAPPESQNWETHAFSGVAGSCPPFLLSSSQQPCKVRNYPSSNGCSHMSKVNKLEIHRIETTQPPDSVLHMALQQRFSVRICINHEACFQSSSPTHRVPTQEAGLGPATDSPRAQAPHGGFMHLSHAQILKNAALYDTEC